MYRCELSQSVPEFKGRKPHVVPAGTLAVKVTIRTRPAEYPSRPKANSHRIGRRMKQFDDPGGAGYEIAQEVLSCRACAQEFATLRVTGLDSEPGVEA
jgi:hypothetical protein